MEIFYHSCEIFHKMTNISKGRKDAQGLKEDSHAPCFLYMWFLVMRVPVRKSRWKTGINKMIVILWAKYSSIYLSLSCGVWPSRCWSRGQILKLNVRKYTCDLWANHGYIFFKGNICPCYFVGKIPGKWSL